MGSKIFKGEQKVLTFRHDFSLENIASGGTKNLGDLPDEFVIQSISVKEVTALTATSTVALGEDGGGAASGYLAATDLSGIVRGEGTLVYNSTDKRPLEYPVIPAKDGLLMTIGTATAIVGVIEVSVVGYQA